MQPRIALLLEYPIALRGGVSVLLSELAEGLGREFLILLVSPDRAGDPLPSGVADHLSFDSHGLNGRRARELVAALQERKVALAHFHLGGTYGWENRRLNACPISHAARAGLPCLTTIHSVGPLLDGFCDPRRPAWQKALLLPCAWAGKISSLAATRAEIAVSDHDLRVLQRFFFPFAAKFCRIYHSRLGSEAATPPASEREPLIVNVGHLAERKGQEILFRAFALLAAEFPQWKLALVGPDLDGTGLAIAREAGRLGLAGRVFLVGSVDDPNPWYRRAGIYVQPSHFEALGLALQEALSSGCPAVGTRVGGIPELIEAGRNGLLVAPGDAPALAAALRELIRSPEERARLGAAAGRSLAEQGFHREAMLEAYRGLYRQALAQEPR